MSATGLLPYQARWVADRSPLKAIEKSRRIGLSWAEAYDSVLHAGQGLGSVYYQSYAKDMTRGFIGDCAAWAGRLQIGAGEVGETIVEEEHAFRLAMASGKEILAMTSAPRAFRSKGRPGDVAVVDEAAFVGDLDEVLKAALAFLMWGGSVHVLSTHNGEASPFAALVRDIREGAQPGSLHRVAFADALADGLGKRIFEIAGRDWSPEAEAEWAAGVRATYGRKAEEELDCIPSAGVGALLPWEQIRACEHAEAGDPERYAGGLAWVGVDIARRRNLWVASAIEQVGDIRWVRQMVVRRNIRFSEQRAIVRELHARYRPVRIAVDQTGMGESEVEHLQDDLGRVTVEGVLLTSPRRLAVATALKEAVEDRLLRIPPDEALRRDLHSVRVETGPTGAPRLVAGTDKDGGHADRFWSLALACAAMHGAGPIGGASAGARASAAFDSGPGPAGTPGAARGVDYARGIVRSPAAGALRGFS